ncbi:MAG: preprotein translocase subunit SecE [Rhodobacteraceae bacterium]|nr:preprotein translocase subunit SecE [Paracoccaceae bacterium]MCY4197986.1 preprotein translocase subunit SecE [Paracoccaceae bacterium]MCY4328071.1 preprotein translocase subunit SecE [Paracoccaceae bacterium]
MAKFSPFQFIQQTRTEVSKVVWPTRRELLVTTAMVFVLAALFAVFFFVVDQIITFGLTSLLDAF